MLEPADLLVWGIIAHLLADWPFQTEWMVLHKTSLNHPAAWAHSGVHLVCMLMVFPWHLAVLIAISHLLIDTRIPVDWWMRVVKGMSRSDPHAFVVETWLDQVFHITVLAFVVLVF
ncbi:MAG: DUF3307 domain-containing protein [Chloroflexota bacterium]